MDGDMTLFCWLLIVRHKARGFFIMFCGTTFLRKAPQLFYTHTKGSSSIEIQVLSLKGDNILSLGYKVGKI